MRPLIALILLAFAALPSWAELVLAQDSFDAFVRDLERSVLFSRRTADHSAGPFSEALEKTIEGQPRPCADLKECLQRTDASLGAMLSSFGTDEERRTEAYRALSEYRAAVSAAAARLSSAEGAPDPQAVYDEHLKPLADKREALLALLKARVPQTAGPGGAQREAPLGGSVEGQVAPMQADLTRARAAGGEQGVLDKAFDNGAPRPSGAPGAMPSGVVVPEGPGGPRSEQLRASYFQPAEFTRLGKGLSGSTGVRELPKASGTGEEGRPAPRPGGLQTSFDEALAALPVMPERLKKDARRRLFSKYEGELSEKLAGERPGLQPLLAEEAKLKAALSEGLRKGADREALGKAFESLQAFYAAHPGLASYNQDRQAHRELLLSALRQGAVPDGFVLDPAELGLRVEGRLTKTTVGGREGLLLEPPRGSKAPRVFKSLDEKLVLEYGPDGKVAKRTELLAGGKVEVHDLGKRLVQTGAVGADGRVRMTGAFIEGTRHPALFDKDGKVAGIELAYDKKTGLPDLRGLVEAGCISRTQAAQFLHRFPSGWIQGGAGGGGDDFLVSPRILFGPSGPVMVYEQALQPGRKAQTSFGFDKESGRCVEVRKFVGKGDDFEQVRMYAGWDPGAGRFDAVEEYKTAYVVRYDATRDFHTAKDTAYTKSVWDPAANRWKEVASRMPKDDNGWDVLTKNISWTFGNVPVYKQVGQGLGVVADGGKFVGYTLTGGAGELIGRASGSEDHLVYGVVSKHQAMAWHPQSGPVMMDELREKLGEDAFRTRRAYWVERYREEMLKSGGLTPTQAAAISQGRLQVSDDDLGRWIVHGGGGEGFGGAGREFASRAAASDGTAGRIGWGLAAAGTYGADFTFQSLGFNALGAGFGALGKAAKTAQGAETLTATGRALVWADRGAKGVQVVQGAYFNSLMAAQGIELGVALSKGDADKVADSLAQFAALGLMPKGRELQPGEPGGMNPRRMVSEFFTTNSLAGAWNKMVDMTLPKADGRAAPEAPPSTEVAATGADSQGRSPLRLSAADRYIGAGAEAQGRAQRLWDATNDLNSMNEKPIELRFKKAPAPFMDAMSLYWTHAKNGGMKGVGYATNAAAALVGGAARTPVESLKMGPGGEITGAGGSGHSNDAGLVFAALARMTKSNKPAHEIVHPMQATLLAGAQQRGLINGPEALGILNSRGGTGYAWGGRSEAAARSVELGGSVDIVFRNLRKNALEYFNANSASPAEARTRYRSFMEYMKGMEGGMRVQYPDLFTVVAKPSVPNRSLGQVVPTALAPSDDDEK